MTAQMIQGSEEWKQARLGKVTASRVNDLMARTKSGYGASRANYMAEIVVERMTGLPQDGGYISGPMLRGIEMEPEARSAYSFYSDNEVVEIGIIDHPHIAMCSASPDGLIGENGLVEIKCPNTSNHIDTLLGGSVPGKYILQVQWQMACSGRKWTDFVSYDSRMPEELALFVRRVERDDEKIAAIEAEVKTFLKEVDSKVSQLLALTTRAAAA